MDSTQKRGGLSRRGDTDLPKKITFLIILTLTFAAIYVVTFAERFSDDVWTLCLRHCHVD